MAARLTAFLVAIIVGISVVAGLIVGAQREAEPAVDLLVYNGRVYTGDPNAPIAEAIAIRGNRILKIGSNREIKRLRRNAATVIDAHGGSILPGFADTYVAVPGQADAIAGIHRLGLTTVGAVVDDLKALDALATLATTADRPIRVAAALKVTLPIAASTRHDIDARRTQSATTLVRLDALAVDVTLPGPKPVRRGRVAASGAAAAPAQRSAAGAARARSRRLAARPARRRRARAVGGARRRRPADRDQHRHRRRRAAIASCWRIRCRSTPRAWRRSA